MEGRDDGNDTFFGFKRNAVKMIARGEVLVSSTSGSDIVVVE